MVIVVTGASGMVGSQIVLALIEAGMGPVRGLYRSAASLESARRSWEFQGFAARWSEVEWVRTDLEDPTAVEAALEGADYAVHAAALVSLRKKDEHLMLRGTPLMAEYVVNGALHHGLKGLIHISSVAVLQGIEMPLDESADPQRKGLNAYARSKFDAEMQARRGEAEGLNVLILNPSVILGLPFWADGSSRLLRSASKGLPAVPGGSTGWVDLRTAQLTKESVRAATNKGGYRNDKARNWGIAFRPFDDTLDWVASPWK